MSRMYLFLCASVSVAVVSLGSTAAAQDLAAAEALFNKGIAEMEAGHYKAACPALRESQRIDPRPGTLFALADCEDKGGRIATASALYMDYLRATVQMKQADKLRHQQRVQKATARKEALAAEIPELTLTLPASAPKGVKIRRDGTELTEASLGIALPLDPGEHVVVTQVPGGPAAEQKITLARGVKRAIELRVEMPGRAEVPAGAPTASKPAGRIPKAPPPDLQPEPGMGARRVVALVAGGVGVAGLALGGITGAMVLSKRSVIQERCDGAICDAEGKAAADAVQLPGTLSTIGFFAGGVGLGAGLLLWVTAPPREEAEGPRVRAMFSVDPSGATVGMKGGW